MGTTELSTAEFPPSGFTRGSNVLLLARASDAAERRACTDLLTAAAGESEDAVLAVTLTHPPSDRVTTWQAHADHQLPDELSFVAVGDRTHGSASIRETGEPRISVKAVADSRNLTQLGVEITRALSALTGDDRQVAVCFDSITALLEANSVDRAFRFLHVLTGQVAGADAVAHYHLDSAGQQEQTVNTLVSLFDAVIERAETGEWLVRTRGPYGE